MKIDTHTDNEGRSVYTAFCREGCGYIENGVNGPFIEGAARSHVKKTGHSVIVGMTW